MPIQKKMHPTVGIVSSTKNGLTVVVYPGDNMVLISLSIEKSKLKIHDGFAGFAIRRKHDGKWEWLTNRLSFEQKITKKTTPEQRVWTTTNDAPIQKFRWIDVPPERIRGSVVYEVTARYFQGKNDLVDGTQVQVTVDFTGHQYKDFEIAFTRGYLSSQAYADAFKNAEIRPKKKSLDYKTAPYQKQYDWLGGDARKAVMDFLDDCLKKKNVVVDVEAYDLDEPDIVKAFEKLGKEKRLRIILDNAPLHTKKGAMEIEARKRITKAAGAANVKVGHFKRFAHDKIIIQRDRTGKGLRVLTGSANFSVRGLYVQANNVLVINDPKTAQKYAEAFDAGFSMMPKFANQPIAASWFTFKGAGLPPFAVSYSPHKNANISLKEVAQHMKAAKSSVFFAIMGLTGSGPVLDEVRKLPNRRGIFSYGTAQSATGLQLAKPDQPLGTVATFDYLKSTVPKPFREEWNGGLGMVIHHKFVVVDFNGKDPIVYTGSSNLAAGGEMSNGDNLLEIRDPAIAVAYAVEAIRLFDHYHFRDAMHSSTSTKPLTLQDVGAKVPWWTPYYKTGEVKYRDRLLFAGVSE
jgi:phosphatidylserine/phosphatidylglycerophosphate/cardiolipin synthase-like enzyme